MLLRKGSERDGEGERMNKTERELTEREGERRLKIAAISYEFDCEKERALRLCSCLI